MPAKKESKRRMNNFRRLIITAPLMATVLCCKAIDIKGLVIDKTTQEPLIGATIQLENSTRGAITDIDGRFSIDKVEKNSFIIVQYVSYQTQRLSVNDLGDKDIVILMSPNDMQLNEVTVVAKKNLEGERALLLERHKSSVAIESIGAKEMSLKGISNVEEGLKKITGISVASSGQIIVRGLGDRYSITTLNGMPIASPNPDNKLIPLDLFPSSTVKNITVNKVYNAADYADYSGAHIDIATKDQNGEDFFNVSFSTGGYINTLGGEFYEMDRSKSLFRNCNLDPKIGDMSLMDFENYSKTNKVFDTNFNVNKKNTIPNLSGKASFGKNIAFENTSKLSILASLSVGNEMSSMKNSMVRTLEASQGKVRSEFYYDSYTNELEIAGLGSVIYTFRKEDHIGYTMFYARNIENEFQNRNGYDKEGVSLIGINDIMHIYTLQNHQIDGYHKLNNKWKIQWKASFSGTSSNEPNRRQMMFQLLNDGNIKFFDLNQQETMRYFGDLNENELTACINSGYQIDEKNKIDFGISYKRKDRDYAGTRFYYNLSEINNGISNIDDIFNTESYFSEKNFEDGKVSIMKLKQPRDSYTSGSDIASGYVTAEVYPIRNLLLNLGLRYEMSKQFVNYHNDQSQLERRELNNHDLFPAINSKYSINEENNLRLSFSRTITRPTFIEMAPFLYEESYGSAQIRGNENLKNGYNYNVDLRYEMINKNGNMISATAYYKFLETPIERTQQIAGGATMHSFNNADNGMAAGIELEIRQAITKDLQVGANGSYMYTNVVLPEGGAYTNTNRALQGASPYLANADITYKHDFKNKQQINFALLYNLQGPRIHSVGVSGLGDITQRPVHTLNLVAGYKINDKINISLKASDLLNNDIVFEQDVPLTGELIEVERFKKGMKFEIGISYQIK